MRGHSVRGFDIRPTEDVADAVVGDLLEISDLDKAMVGMDALIHLAATKMRRP